MPASARHAHWWPVVERRPQLPQQFRRTKPISMRWKRELWPGTLASQSQRIAASDWLAVFAPVGARERQQACVQAVLAVAQQFVLPPASGRQGADAAAPDQLLEMPAQCCLRHPEIAREGGNVESPTRGEPTQDLDAARVGERGGGVEDEPIDLCKSDVTPGSWPKVGGTLNGFR